MELFTKMTTTASRVGLVLLRRGLLNIFIAATQVDGGVGGALWYIVCACVSR